MGRKALPEGDRKRRLVAYVTAAQWERLEGLGSGEATAGLQRLLEVGVLPGSAIPRPFVPTGEPPSGAKCKTPWKCGRGIIACDPCRAVAEGSK